MLPDTTAFVAPWATIRSQCTYRCVVLPDLFPEEENGNPFSLNAPTGAWCSLTITDLKVGMKIRVSQCTYRCVVLPDAPLGPADIAYVVASQCTYRCVVLPDRRLVSRHGRRARSLNAPTGAWCSLTLLGRLLHTRGFRLNAPTGAWCSLTLIRKGVGPWLTSQCTYRCVVLPDDTEQAAREASLASQCTYRCVVLPDPCSREWRYDATSRARSATGPGSTPPDRPAPGSD